MLGGSQLELSVLLLAAQSRQLRLAISQLLLEGLELVNKHVGCLDGA